MLLRHGRARLAGGGAAGSRPACPPRQRLVALAVARARRPASPSAVATDAAVAAPAPTTTPPPTSSPSSPATTPEQLDLLQSLLLPPKDLPPGFPDSEPPSLAERLLRPLKLGDMAAFVQRPAAFLADRRAAHGDAFAADNILLKPTVFLFDETDVRKALAAEHRLVEQRWPSAFAALLGPSFQGGKARHAFHRRAMGAAFTNEAIAAYQPFLQRLIERRLETARLDAEKKLQSGTGDGTVPAWTENHILAFDVAATLLLGFGDLGEDATRELHGLFRTFVQGFVLSPPLDLPITRYGRALRARRRIVELLSRHLEPVMARVAAEEAEQAEEGRMSGGNGTSSNNNTSTAATTALRAFLTARDDDGRRVTLEEAKEIVLFVAFAGHETTGTSVSQALRLLDAHRPCWQKLVEEQKRVVARHGPELTAAAAADMPYADAVAREALRQCPVVRFVWREALEDFAVGGGGGNGPKWRVAAGTQVVCSLSQPIDDIPLFAADADVFRPERWLEPTAATTTGNDDPLASPWRLIPAPSGFLPFGAGGRVCLGLPLAVAEMRAYLAVMARKYEFEVWWPGGKAWDGKATEAGFLVPGDMPVRLTPRRG